jgi:hypothetical protein
MDHLLQCNFSVVSERTGAWQDVRLNYRKNVVQLRKCLLAKVPKHWDREAFIVVLKKNSLCKILYVLPIETDHPFESFWTPAIMCVALQVICLNVTLSSALPTWMPCGSMFNVNRNPYHEYVIYFSRHYHLVSHNVWCSCFHEETTKLDGTAFCI